jgi:hypothetical protein
MPSYTRQRCVKFWCLSTNAIQNNLHAVLYVVTAHSVISSSKVNFSKHSDYVCYEIAEDASLLVCDAAPTGKQLAIFRRVEEPWRWRCHDPSKFGNCLPVDIAENPWRVESSVPLLFYIFGVVWFFLVHCHVKFHDPLFKWNLSLFLPERLSCLPCWYC